MLSPQDHLLFLVKITLRLIITRLLDRKHQRKEKTRNQSVIYGWSPDKYIQVYLPQHFYINLIHILAQQTNKPDQRWLCHYVCDLKDRSTYLFKRRCSSHVNLLIVICGNTFGEHIGFAECLGVILAYLRYSLLYSTVFRRATYFYLDEIRGFDWAILGHSPLCSSVPLVIILYFVWDHSRNNELSKMSFFYLATRPLPGDKIQLQHDAVTACLLCGQ